MQLELETGLHKISSTLFNMTVKLGNNNSNYGDEQKEGWVSEC